MRNRILLSLGAIAGVFLLHQVVSTTETGSATHRETTSLVQATTPPPTESARANPWPRPADRLVKQSEAARPTNDDPHDGTPPDALSNSLLRQLEAAWKTDGPRNSAAFFTLLTKLVESNPTGAARFAESLPGGPERSEALVRVTQNWAGYDSASAESWAAQLPDRNERQAALANVCFKVSEANPAEAVQMAVNNQLDTVPGVLENLVSPWANQDFAGAVAWAKSQRSGQRRDQIFERLSAIESATAPAEAAKRVADEIAPGPVQDRAVVSVLTTWATRDATSAMAWVNQFPSGSLKDRAKDLIANIVASNQGRKEN